MKNAQKPNCEGLDNMRGQNVLLVGGSSRIGKALARSLYRRGASVINVDELIPDYPVEFIRTCLDTTRSQRRFAETFADTDLIDILIFCQRLYSAPAYHTDNGEGLEDTLVTSAMCARVILDVFRQTPKFHARTFIMGAGSRRNDSLYDLNCMSKPYNQLHTLKDTALATDAIVLGYRRKKHADVFGLKTQFIDNADEYAESIMNVICHTSLSHAFYNQFGEPIKVSSKMNVDEIWNAIELLIDNASG